MNKKVLIGLLGLAVLLSTAVGATFWDAFDAVKPCFTNSEALDLFSNQRVVIFPQNTEVCSYVMRAKGLSACSSVVLVSWENLQPLVESGFRPSSPGQFAIDNGVDIRKKLIVYNIPKDLIARLVLLSDGLVGSGGAGSAGAGDVSPVDGECEVNTLNIFSAFQHVAIISGDLEDPESCTSMHYLNASRMFVLASDAVTPKKVAVYFSDYCFMSDYPAEGF